MTDTKCWDCGAVFNPLRAFHGNGCPECSAKLEDLFQQRDDEDAPNPENVQISRNHDGTVEVVEG